MTLAFTPIPRSVCQGVGKAGVMSEKDHFLKVSQLFDRGVSTGWAKQMEIEHEPVARAAFRRARLQAGQSYLDIGCGNGDTVRWACGVHPTVEGYGIDVSAQMIHVARNRSTPFKNARFIHSVFPLRELKAQSFDAIIAVESLYYMPDLLWALVNVNRLLKPGGRFVCTMDRYGDVVGQRPWDDESVRTHVLSAEEWRALFAEAGLITFEQTCITAAHQQADVPACRGPLEHLLMVARRPILED